MPVELLTATELFALPLPQWLIEGFIEKDGIATIYGPSGSGKSFISLAWALSVATGRPWLDRVPVQQAPVVYVAAEGGRSIQKRVGAWLSHYGLHVGDLDPAQFVVRPVYLRDPEEVAEFVLTLSHQDCYPGLVVVDTLAQSFGAGDENSLDMQEFVSGMTELRNARNMSILVVYHTNALGERERGHSSLRAGMDQMFHTTAKHDPDYRLLEVTLTNDKQKDAETMARVRMVPVLKGKSLVLVENAAPEPKRLDRARVESIMDDPSYLNDTKRAEMLAREYGMQAGSILRRIQRYRSEQEGA